MGPDPSLADESVPISALHKLRHFIGNTLLFVSCGGFLVFGGLFLLHFFVSSGFDTYNPECPPQAQRYC